MVNRLHSVILHSQNNFYQFQLKYRIVRLKSLEIKGFKSFADKFETLKVMLYIYMDKIISIEKRLDFSM